MSSSPGCSIGLSPLFAPGCTVAMAPPRKKRPYGPEMPARAMAPWGGEMGVAVATPYVSDGPVLAELFLDEVRHGPIEGGRDLQQRGDGGHHAPALDLMDGGRRHVGLDRELLERHPTLNPELAQLGPDRTHDLVEVARPATVVVEISVVRRLLARRKLSCGHGMTS